MERFKTNDWIQSSIGLLIAITLIVSAISVREQIKFNENTLRPWIAPEISGQLVFEKSGVSYSIYLSNVGYSPALDVYMYSTLFSEKEFPVDTIRQKIQDFEKFKKGIIFPNQRRVKYNNYSNLDRNVDSLSIKQLCELILEKDTYLHIYLIYLSSDNQTYYLRESFQMKYLEDTENGMKVDWIFLGNSLEKI